MTEKSLIPKVDLIKDSYTHLMTVSFAKTASKNYALAVNIAQCAEKYDELKIGNSLVHFVAFSKTKEDASRALVLLRYISEWKSIQIVTGGKIIQKAYDVAAVLECYLEALACNDYQAHCFSIVNDPRSDYPYAYGMSVSIKISPYPEPEPEEVMVDRYIFPCSLLQPYFKFQTDHPSTAENQIQAAAVEHGCDWCPLFKAHNFKKTGGQANART